MSLGDIMTYVLLVMFISVTVSELSVDSIIIILYVKFVNNDTASTTGGNHDNLTVSFSLNSWDNEEGLSGPKSKR